LVGERKEASFRKRNESSRPPKGASDARIVREEGRTAPVCRKGKALSLSLNKKKKGEKKRDKRYRS